MGTHQGHAAGQVGRPGVTAKDNRLFIDAVLWIAQQVLLARSSAAIWTLELRVARFDRWSKKGVWERIMTQLGEPDFEKLILRQHRHPGINTRPQKRGSDVPFRSFSRWIQYQDSYLGRWKRRTNQADSERGTRIRHQASSRTHRGAKLKCVIGDKGYDSDEFVKAIEAGGATAVIPPRENRTKQREYDKDLYKDRNLVERFWSRMKQFRRVATSLYREDGLQLPRLCTHSGDHGPACEVGVAIVFSKCPHALIQKSTLCHKLLTARDPKNGLSHRSLLRAGELSRPERATSGHFHHAFQLGGHFDRFAWFRFRYTMPGVAAKAPRPCANQD